ncbi:DUF1641 domain-containing protein [Alteribacillus iranensis]|uniref:Uncharacterized conserved protein YjgD, DUF1641 family n=1 Tax=Alteribacillus iranensis TaxID=930128 RepID=A0A1I1ZXC3_9BACI|nr:DUF1641 domain-containing protein [Alteribacillus iranensis]SFE36239.1 Uncharacterized conserved protein YjgD, DUF1641 family [Alteribacillus iranensis]
MARKIESIKKWELTEEEKRQKDLREIEDALIDNKEAILQTVDILNHANNNGLLSLVNGLLSEGEQVLKVLMDAINKPESTNAIRNLLLILGVAGKLNIKELEPILLKVNNGIEHVSENSGSGQKTGYLDLVRALKDPEINRALTLMMTFLKGMGQDTDDEMKSKERMPDQKV